MAVVRSELAPLRRFRVRATALVALALVLASAGCSDDVPTESSVAADAPNETDAAGGGPTETNVACEAPQRAAGATLATAFAEAIGFASAPGSSNKDIGRNLPDLASDALGLQRIGSCVAGQPTERGYSYAYTAYLHSQPGTVTGSGQITTNGEVISIACTAESTASFNGSSPSRSDTSGELRVKDATLAGSIHSSFSGLGGPPDLRPEKLRLQAELVYEAGCVVSGVVSLAGSLDGEPQRRVRFRWTGCNQVACE